MTIKDKIKSRILAEYEKYHDMPMDHKDDWAMIASCKIASEMKEWDLEMVDNIGDLRVEKMQDCKNYTSDLDKSIAYDDGFDAGRDETKASIKYAIHQQK